MEDYLQQIDWLNHDGVNLSMINDFMRNQFYERIMRDAVCNTDCTDVGFGTGLLSIIALKHGARHIRAFESDPNRYLLGREIIDKLGLNHRIELINERYDYTVKPTSVTFSETVNGNLWWEGLWNSLPRESNTQFLPSKYFLEIWAVAVPSSFAQGLCRSGNTKQRFVPGIDLDQQFIDCVNSFRNVPSSVNTALLPGITYFARQQETDWGWIPYMRAAQAGSVVASYCVEHADDRQCFELAVNLDPWADKILLLVPRMGMQHNWHKLYLDTGHWGPAEDPVLVVRTSGQLLIRHNVSNGVLTYTLDH